MPSAGQAVHSKLLIMDSEGMSRKRTWTWTERSYGRKDNGEEEKRLGSITSSHSENHNLGRAVVRVAPRLSSQDTALKACSGTLMGQDLGHHTEQPKVRLNRISAITFPATMKTRGERQRNRSPLSGKPFPVRRDHTESSRQQVVLKPSIAAARIASNMGM